MNRHIAQALHSCVKGRFRDGTTKAVQGLTVPRKAERRREHPVPYKTTPVFDENTLPAGLRRKHRTKAGVWGVIRVPKGRLQYRTLDQASEVILDPDHPRLMLPDVPHLIEPLGAMRMQIEFYDQPPPAAG